MENSKNENGTRNKTLQMAFIAVMAAVTCILGPLSIPIGPVPISLTNLAVYFAIYILGMKRGSLSYIVYMLLGIVGLPVFSGFSGGIGKFAGPTGGYILGFLVMGIISGIFIDRFIDRWYLCLLGMILGTSVDYVMGTAWFMYQTQMTLMESLALCVFPFIIGDLVKMVIAMLAGPQIRKQLMKAGLFPEK